MNRNRIDDYPTLAELLDDIVHPAAFDEMAWNHSSAYYHYLLRRLPTPCRKALEIGCGTGAFARLLTRRAKRVLALDLSPRMINLVQERSQGYENIEYSVADGLSESLPLASYDCVATISTLHHLNLEVAMVRLVSLLSPGGVLLVLDLYRASCISDYLLSALALPANLFLRLMHGNLKRKPAPVRKAWSAHQRHKRFLTLVQVRRICEAVVPGAYLRRHLLWRYSIIWMKPNG